MIPVTFSFARTVDMTNTPPPPYSKWLTQLWSTAGPCLGGVGLTDRMLGDLISQALGRDFSSQVLESSVGISSYLIFQIQFFKNKFSEVSGWFQG